jgi:ubiquinone/menaquinone biosynthesis C-methylase UbiE
VHWINTDATGAGTWDRQARRYARQERLEFRAIDAAIELAAFTPPDRLADLATGTGLLLRRLAARDGRPRVAVGVDRSPGMLERVGPLPDGWSTIRADARRAPLVDGSADVVTCVYLLQLRDPVQRGAVLAEAHRLLAPGAGSRLVVVTPWADPRRPGGWIVRAALTLLADVRPTTLGGLRACDPTAELVDAGFVVTRRRVLPRGGYPSLVLLARLSRSA